MTNREKTVPLTGMEIAVIGMAGRFPGARNINEFWENLKNGVESISFLSDKELEEAGVDKELIDNPNYVKANANLENRDMFDASFFGYTPMEAELMNPQIRLFHECAWEALEDAGYIPDTYDGKIGLYGGASNHFYWQALVHLSGKSDELGVFASSQLIHEDYLCTRVSYNLNLNGASLYVHTTCSTSLVAIHQACRALLTAESDIVLAGGAGITSVPRQGYLYQQGMISSSDGHCRAFDARTDGTFRGEGVAIVVLKRLKPALEDRDHIYAIIRGTAINNDGNRKVGFTAPSVEAQSEVIRTALRMARVEAESIAYVEAHGTGTELGDPVEIEALKIAFNTEKKNYCGIGSVKTNIGHLDAAAGAAGFIKTVLALKHKLIPPSLHFETANPRIDFKNSPFYVNAKLREWQCDGFPLRAGVSSFGIGGTNAHVVVEEWPKDGSPEGQKMLRPQLILLSAKTPTALDKMTENLAKYLKENPANPGQNPGLTLADAAYTLQVGRKSFRHRLMFPCSSVREASDILSTPDSPQIRMFSLKNEKEKRVIYMFSGQGSQYADMGFDLYETEPVFREEMDRCFDILRPLMGYDIKEVLYPSSASSAFGVRSPAASAAKDINQTEIAQPVLFAFEYALAQLLMKWGVKPYAMIGHSIGEYAAACLAEVFSLEDAIKLVVLRGKLMQRVPGGAMLSVPLSEEQLIPLLNRHVSLSLAAVNSSSHCVVSGSHEAIDEFEKQLKRKGYESTRLHTSHAFHSSMMDAILKDFEEEVKQVKLQKPKLPYICNVTGDWAAAGEIVSPGYWAGHIRSTVRFSTGLEMLLKEQEAIFLELGPGKALTTFVRQHNNKTSDQLIMNLVRHPKEDISDYYFLLDKIGQLWLYGKDIDWHAFYPGETGHRISLPTYPFEGRRFWIEKVNSNMVTLSGQTGSDGKRKANMADWFYVPLWEQSTPLPHTSPEVPEQSDWLLFIDEYGVAAGLVNRLEQAGHRVTTVGAGDDFSRVKDGAYMIDPCEGKDYDTLFKELQESNQIPRKILHFWGVTGNNNNDLDFEDLNRAQDLGLYSLFNIVQAIGRQGIGSDIEIGVVTDNLQEVTGEEQVRPEKATLLGAVKVISVEYQNLHCRSVDIVLPPPGSPQADALISRLFGEFMLDSSEKVVAWRGKYRWLHRISPCRLEAVEPKQIKEKGVYLITGGFGGMGFTIAEHLAKKFKARLILLGRSDFPARKEWNRWVAYHEEDDPVTLKIRKIRKLESYGARVKAFCANVSDYEQMKEVIDQAREGFGKIDGVLHTAGVIDYAGVIQRRTREMNEQVMASKVKGTLVLERILKDEKLDIFVLFSSVGNFLYGYKFAQVGYSAANEFLDAFAYYKNAGADTFTVSINWCDWKEVGMTVAAIKHEHEYSGKTGDIDYQSQLYDALSPEEGIRVFERILGSGFSRVIPTTVDLIKKMEEVNRREEKDIYSSEEVEETGEADYPGSLQQRPELRTPYTAPVGETEQKLAALFQGFFGIEKVGVHDDFFELGGDSLKAITVAAKIHKELNVEIPIAEFFARPTIQSLAKYINIKGDKSEYDSIEPVEEKEYYDLSAAQKRMYVLQQMDIQSTAYNVPGVFVIEKKLDIEKIGETFKKLIKRHESLRTSFEAIQGEPVQRVHGFAEVQFEIEHYHKALTDNVINHFIRSFDLMQAPLLRVGLVEEEEKFTLIIDTHHIIIDGFSNFILLKDFSMLYEGEELPGLRIQYKDYSEWQNRLYEKGYMKKRGQYWLNRFEKSVPPLKVPPDYPAASSISSKSGWVHFEINRGVTGKIKKLSREVGTTLFVFLLAIYNILLSKYTLKEDVVVGIPTAGRHHAGLQDVIGMFVNMLAIRNFPGSQKTFRVFLMEVRQDVIDAIENQDYPFDELVMRLRPGRESVRNPLVENVFVMENVVDIPQVDINSSSTPDNFKYRQYEYQGIEAKFDLVLSAIENENGINFELEYRINLFMRETIERMGQHFRAIIDQVIENPGIPISEIEIPGTQSRIDKKDNRGVLEDSEAEFDF